MKVEHDPLHPTEGTILRCSTKKAAEEPAYGKFNTLRSAIGLISANKFAESSLIKRFLKGAPDHDNAAGAGSTV